MIEIGINPNTNIPSVAIRLNGYFGLGRDGVKLVDSDTVFQANTIKLAGVLPITAFDTLQTEEKQHGDNTDKERDSKGRFMAGNRVSVGNKGNTRSKTPLADLMREVAMTKHYKIKDTGEYVVAEELIAEKIVDKIVEKGDARMLELFLDRTEGKVTQGVRLSGALSHGVIPDKDLEKLKEIFPDLN